MYLRHLEVVGSVQGLGSAPGIPYSTLLQMLKLEKCRVIRRGGGGVIVYYKMKIERGGGHQFGSK